MTEKQLVSSEVTVTRRHKTTRTSSLIHFTRISRYCTDITAHKSQSNFKGHSLKSAKEKCNVALWEYF